MPLDSCVETWHDSDVAVLADRQELAFALHDTVGAELYGLQVGIRDLCGRLEATGPLKERADELERRVLDLGVTLRTVLRDLSTVPPDQSFGVALCADCQAFERRTGIDVTLDLAARRALTLDATRAGALLGALREALLNVEKHADASAVTVTCQRRGDVVHLSVADNGHGDLCRRRPARSLAGRGGLGLRAHRHRFERLGGDLSLDASPGRGAVLRAQVPL